jgi:tRNA(Arg) A34 adenosine deaminase TadA
MCAGALYWSQISKIVLEQAMSTVDLKMGTQLHQNRRKTGVLAEEADLMKRFFC